MPRRAMAEVLLCTLTPQRHLVSFLAQSLLHHIISQEAFLTLIIQTHTHTHTHSTHTHSHTPHTHTHTCHTHTNTPHTHTHSVISFSLIYLYIHTHTHISSSLPLTSLS